MAAANLTVRIGTAVVMVPLILALLFLGPAWGWLAFGLVCATLGAVELFGMTHPGDRVAEAAGVIMTCAVVGALCLWGREPRVFVCLILLVPFAGIVLTLLRLGDLRTAALRLVAAGFAPLYLGGGFGAIAGLRVAGGSSGAAYVVLSMVLAWMSDTGGYFAGKALGKHKLYEAVSPKKTVEGAIGGVLAAVGGAFVLRAIALRSMPWQDTLALGALATIMGQLGDLGESVLKRSVGVKDSGAVVPGHGGMLDRVDALLITAPIVLCYVLWHR